MQKKEGGTNPGQLGNSNWGLMTEPPATQTELESFGKSQIIAT